MLVAVPLVFALVACGAAGPAQTATPAQKTAPAKKPLPDAPPPPPMPPEDQLVCPADVQACPDGSFVGRNPAQGCAFNPCPAGKQ